MNAEEALTAYGYQLRKGRYTHSTSKTSFEKTEGGWLRFDREMGIGYQILPEFRDFSGIEQGRHAIAWDMVWPDDWIVMTYEEGARQNQIRAAEAAERKTTVVFSGGTGVGGWAPNPDVVMAKIQEIIDARPPEPEPEPEPEPVIDEPEPEKKRPWWKIG